MLIGYIPTTGLDGITNMAGRRRAQANLFHGCMESLLDPIRSCGETGVALKSADNIWRRCHPVLAVFVGDYPEQALVTCTYYGRCSKCEVPHDRLGEFLEFPSRVPSDAIDIYRLADEDVRAFNRACRGAGLKPVYHPFWQSMPFANIFRSITPDILHQMLQGVMKHVIAWVTSSTVFGSTVIKARCRILPPNHNITVFSKGIGIFARASGQEHKNMCRVLLGLILDLPLRGGMVSSRAVKAVRAILDFLYLAQYPSHTSESLQRLDISLAHFHENKDIFIDLGTRGNFNLPKLHSLLHYTSSIRLFGSTDNYNTEQTERLHIDFAKDAYRSTNHKGEYIQMTSWLERREKMRRHAAHIDRQQENSQPETHVTLPIGLPVAGNRYLRIAIRSRKTVSFEDLASQYGAAHFQDALADFIARLNYPDDSTRSLRTRAEDTLIPFRAVPVFHKFRFVSEDQVTVDAVHMRPEQIDLHGQLTPSRFDTVLVHNGQDDQDRTSGINSKSVTSNTVRIGLV